MVNSTHHQPIKQRGYTLLELLLSLTLSVVVVSSIGMAIQLYLISLTRQQDAIERKQVARNVLQMISGDIRAGLQYKAADYSGLENLVQTQLLSGAYLQQGSDTAGSSTTESATGSVAAGSDSQPAAPQTGSALDADGSVAAAPSDLSSLPSPDQLPDSAQTLVDEASVSFRPSMVGGPNTISVDISRLPRLDQYNPIIASQPDAGETRSDVKSLAYFFSNASPTDPAATSSSSAVAPGGLYRRRIDRAVASFNGDVDQVSAPDENSQLIASEVAEIQFRYFDGETWLTSWDSDANEGFPPAVEIVLVMDPQRTSAGNDYSYSGQDQESVEVFRSVVHLPGAEMPQEEEQ